MSKVFDGRDKDCWDKVQHEIESGYLETSEDGYWLEEIIVTHTSMADIENNLPVEYDSTNAYDTFYSGNGLQVLYEGEDGSCTISKYGDGTTGSDEKE